MTEPRHSDHYKKNHLGKPRKFFEQNPNFCAYFIYFILFFIYADEYHVSGINPLTQQKETPKNETAYTFFYIALIVGVVLLILMLIGMWRNYKETLDFVNGVQIRENERRIKAESRKKMIKKDQSTFTTGE
jgi:Na+/melibiose symporter-like transporter